VRPNLKLGHWAAETQLHHGILKGGQSHVPSIRLPSFFARQMRKKSHQESWQTQNRNLHWYDHLTPLQWTFCFGPKWSAGLQSSALAFTAEYQCPVEKTVSTKSPCSLLSYPVLAKAFCGRGKKKPLAEILTDLQLDFSPCTPVFSFLFFLPQHERQVPRKQEKGKLYSA
jgi:hypothetical protein